MRKEPCNKESDPSGTGENRDRNSTRESGDLIHFRGGGVYRRLLVTLELRQFLLNQLMSQRLATHNKLRDGTRRVYTDALVKDPPGRCKCVESLTKMVQFLLRTRLGKLEHFLNIFSDLSQLRVDLS